MALKLRCLSCKKACDERRSYHGEAFCKICWTRRVPQHYQRTYRWLVSDWRRTEKMDLQFNRSSFLYYSNAASAQALNWAKIRRDVELPPFPAGLRSFLIEVFDDRNP